MADEMAMDQAPVETSETEDVELNDVDDIADAFGANEDDEPAEEGGSDQPDQSEPASGETEQQEQVQVLPQPDGWEDTMWQGLTPEVQQHINERVQAHAQQLAAAEQAQAQLRAQQEQFAQQANIQMQQALTTMKQVIEGEYGQIDWQQLAATDPASYVKLQQMYGARMQAIKQIQGNVTAQAQAMQQQRAATEAKALDNEYNAVLPEIKALVGKGFEGRGYAAEIANYMLTQGVPKEAINSVTKGYELKLATKAMLYDKLLAQRSKAMAKVANAPQVAAPTKGQAAEVNQGKRGKAMAALNRNPDSVDALANLFEVL